MNRVWHDIVVGDFGREGTLRYLRAFEVAERRIIVQRLVGRPFFDEMRRVKYTVLGALRQIKAEFLPASDAEIDHRVLIGTRNGLEQTSVRQQLFDLITPYLRLAAQNNANAIRVVIPCNSLSDTAMWLSQCMGIPPGIGHEANAGDDIGTMPPVLCLPPDVTVVVPHLPTIVLEYLNTIGVRNVLFVGTQDALSAYMNTAKALGFHMTIRCWPPPGTMDFGTWLQECTESGCPDLSVAMNVEAGEVIVCGCTDLRVPGAIDSVEILAERLATDVYCDADNND